VGSVGRSVELERLCQSLEAQTYRNFELILVDQNSDDRAKEVFDRYRSRFTAKRMCSPRGLSRARNVGLQQASGDLIAFPDDDCWYPTDVLQHVASRFQHDEKLCGLTGCSVDADGRPSQGRWASKPLAVDRYNIWTCATSYTIFLRARAVREVGAFDETLGVGSGTAWGAGEEVDYLLRVLRQPSGYIHYDPTLKIHHPEPILTFEDKAVSRARLYNRGFGRVLRLHRYPLPFVLYLVSRPLTGAILSSLQLKAGRARYYWTAATQRLLGWWLKA
jgi:glycosyltransferase involved in cell wall biosynthesis